METSKENTKELQITINYDEKKLEAMQYFMGQKHVTIESAMEQHVSDLYEKYVPSAMRKFLNRNDTEQQTSKPEKGETAETLKDQGQSAGRKRKDRQQTQEPNQSVSSTLEEQVGETAEENTQGMSMSM